MIYQQFTIDYNSLIVKGGKVEYPFYIVMQTKDRELERYCIKKWPRLMDITTMYSFADKAEHIKLKSYVQRNFLMMSSEVNAIHQMFYERNLFGNFGQSLEFSKITLNDFDCKVWTNPEVPFLQIKGTISIDVNKILEYYIHRGLIGFKVDNKFIKSNIRLYLEPLPKILIFMESNIIKDMILNFIIKKCNTAGNKISDKLETITKLPKVYSFKKEIQWYNDFTITITINDWENILGVKIKKHILPLTIGGFVAYKAIKTLNKMR
jgi:hypothetical protein